MTKTYCYRFTGFINNPFNTIVQHDFIVYNVDF